MKKTMVFFCDLMNTFSGLENNKVLRKMYVSKLLINLQSIKQMYNLDKVIFSFISTDTDTNKMLEYLNELECCIKELNLKIDLENQFFDNGYIDFKDNKNIIEENYKNKPLTIFSYLKYLRKSNDIQLCCYADDSEFNQVLFIEIKRLLEDNTECKLFIPGSEKDFEGKAYNTKISEIVGLNDVISKMIYEENLKRNKDDIKSK